MEKEIIDWEMDGSAHVTQIETLRIELSESIAQGRAYSIRRIFELLPVESAQADEAIGRGDIEISGNTLRNSAVSSLRLEFTDPAMGRFSVIVPSAVEMSSSTNAGSTLAFEIAGQDVEFELPKLSELGFRLSEFQMLRTLTFDDGLFSMLLQDSVEATKYLQVLVRLRITTDATDFAAPLAAAKAFVSFENLCGGPGDEDGEYFVARANATRQCIVVEGRPPSVQYPQTMATGFSTYAEASAWIDEHCNDVGTCA